MNGSVHKWKVGYLKVKTVDSGSRAGERCSGGGDRRGVRCASRRQRWDEQTAGSGG